MTKLQQMISGQRRRIGDEQRVRAGYVAEIEAVHRATTNLRGEQGDLSESQSATVTRAAAARDAADQLIRDMTEGLDRLLAEELGEQQSRELAVMLGGGPQRGGRGDGGLNGHRGDGSSWLPTRAQYADMQTRATTTVSGGAFIPLEQSRVFADRLRAHSIVIGSGIQMLPVQFGTLRIPRITASVTVSATAENSLINPTDPAFAYVSLVLKKFAAMVTVSNESLSESQPQLRAVIEEDLVRSVATALDQQFLAGTGAAGSLLGVRNWAGVTPGPSFGANGRTPVLADFAAAMTLFESANGDVSKARWLMSPRTWGSLRSLTDSQGRYLIEPDPTTSEARSLYGVPVLTSSNVSVTDTLGTSADTSWCALLDVSQVAIGYGVPEVGSSTSYVGGPIQTGWINDGDGADLGIQVAVSDQYLFNYDATAIRVLGRFDIVSLNPASVVLMSGIRP